MKFLKEAETLATKKVTEKDPVKVKELQKEHQKKCAEAKKRAETAEKEAKAMEDLLDQVLFTAVIL